MTQIVVEAFNVRSMVSGLIMTDHRVSNYVSGRQSSRVTKVPLAKLHRVFKFMESLSVMERNRKRRKVK